MLLGTPATQAQDLMFALPAFLSSPSVSNSSLGTTYTYLGKAPHAHALLQLTVLDVPGDLALGQSFTVDRCITLLLDEIERQEHGFFAAPSKRRLTVGDLSLTQMRWTHKKDEREMTGIAACGTLGDRYLSVLFRDTLRDAVDSFPEIRNALSTLNPSPTTP